MPAEDEKAQLLLGAKEVVFTGGTIAAEVKQTVSECLTSGPMSRQVLAAVVGCGLEDDRLRREAFCRLLDLSGRIESNDTWSTMYMSEGLLFLTNEEHIE